ncbi:MAG: hypothetical protein ACPGE9_04890 [Algiphilus sp.]
MTVRNASRALACRLLTACGAAAALGAMPAVSGADVGARAGDPVAELPVIVVRPDADDPLVESDRNLRVIIHGLPDVEPPEKLDFGVWVLHALGLSGPTIQDAPYDVQVRARALSDRLEGATPE